MEVSMVKNVLRAQQVKVGGVLYLTPPLGAFEVAVGGVIHICHLLAIDSTLMKL